MFLHQLDRYTVGDIMDQRLITLKKNAEIQQAINAMINQNLDDIILTDSEEKAIAVFTFKDLIRNIRSNEDLKKTFK